MEIVITCRCSVCEEEGGEKVESKRTKPTVSRCWRKLVPDYLSLLVKQCLYCPLLHMRTVKMNSLFVWHLHFNLYFRTSLMDKVESIYMFLFMYRRCLNQHCEAVCFTFIHILLLSIFLLPFPLLSLPTLPPPHSL